MTFQTQFPQLLQRIKADSPLIHCITNHISIHDCANALLALGASPIMAEHPGEVAEITATSQSLMVNLGNISDSRMEAIAAAGETARTHHIPCMIDLVGVGCSQLRRSFAHGFLLRAHPAVIKGNESEIRAICGVEHHARGIDNGEHGPLAQALTVAKQAARQFHTVVLLSGKTDLITDGVCAFGVENGDPLMARVTGTGCMQGAVVAAFLAVASPLEAALSGAAAMGLAGEYAAEQFQSHGSISQFSLGILDGLFSLRDAAALRMIPL